MTNIITKDQFDKFNKRYRVNFINSLSGFKGVNLIGTKDSQGHENLSIVSSVIHVGADPAAVGMLFRPNTVPRHTYENIIETGWFTVNSVDKNSFVQAHQTGARYDKSISEFEAVGLDTMYLDGCYAPFVKQSSLQFGCKLVEKYDVKLNGTHFVIGEIECVNIDDSFIDDEGRICLEKFDTVCVNGLDRYLETQFIEQLPYAKP